MTNLSRLYLAPSLHLPLGFGLGLGLAGLLGPADAQARMPKTDICPACEIITGGPQLGSAPGNEAGPGPASNAVLGSNAALGSDNQNPTPSSTPAPFDEGDPLGPPITEPHSNLCPACNINGGGTGGGGTTGRGDGTTGRGGRNTSAERTADEAEMRAPAGFAWVPSALRGVVDAVDLLRDVAPADALNLPGLADLVADLLPVHTALGPALPAFTEALSGDDANASTPAFVAAYTACVASPSCLPDAEGADVLLDARGALGHPATDPLALALGCLADDACLDAAANAERNLRWGAGAVRIEAPHWRHAATATMFGALCIVDDDCRDGLTPLRDLAEALSPHGTDDLAAVLLAAGRAAGADR